MYVYLLEHMKNKDDYESVKSLGVYSTITQAQDAILRYRTLPGFKDYPDGFNIDKYKVSEDCWPEGFDSY